MAGKMRYLSGQSDREAGFHHSMANEPLFLAHFPPYQHIPSHGAGIWNIGVDPKDKIHIEQPTVIV
jgi:hypothetical protein